MIRLRTILFALLLAPPALAEETKPRTVAQPTRLDWSFTVGNRSQAEPPADLLGTGYGYELFLPVRKDPKQLVGVVVDLRFAGRGLLQGRMQTRGRTQAPRG